MASGIAVAVGLALAISVAAQTAPLQNRATLGGKPAEAAVLIVIDPEDFPKSVADLVALSPVIVVGTSVSEMPGRQSPSNVVTDRIVRVDRVLKGPIPVRTQIAVEEPGGILPGNGPRVLRAEVGHLNPIQPDGRYILFLQAARNQPVGDRFDGSRYWVAGVWAGSFRIVNGLVRLSDGDSAGLRAWDGMAEAEVLAAVENAIAAR